MAGLGNSIDASTTGFQSLNSATGIWNGRTFTAGSGISITNGTGTAGNPTISLSGTPTTTSWTPNLQFGGLQVGITYGNQTGWYTQIGDVVFFQFNVVLTSKGTSVGTATISNLPIAAGASNVGTQGVLSIGAVTLPAGTTFTNFSIQGAGTVLNLGAFGSVVGSAFLANTNFVNTSQIVGTGFYTVS